MSYFNCFFEINSFEQLVFNDSIENNSLNNSLETKRFVIYFEHKRIVYFKTLYVMDK